MSFLSSRFFWFCNFFAAEYSTTFRQEDNDWISFLSDRYTRSGLFASIYTTHIMYVDMLSRSLRVLFHCAAMFLCHFSESFLCRLSSLSSLLRAQISAAGILFTARCTFLLFCISSLQPGFLSFLSSSLRLQEIPHWALGHLHFLRPQRLLSHFLFNMRFHTYSSLYFSSFCSVFTDSHLLLLWWPRLPIYCLLFSSLFIWVFLYSAFLSMFTFSSQFLSVSLSRSGSAPAAAAGAASH